MAEQQPPSTFSMSATDEETDKAYLPPLSRTIDPRGKPPSSVDPRIAATSACQVFLRGAIGPPAKDRYRTVLDITTGMLHTWFVERPVQLQNKIKTPERGTRYRPNFRFAAYRFVHADLYKLCVTRPLEAEQVEPTPF